jgi:hypothetical protein
VAAKKARKLNAGAMIWRNVFRRARQQGGPWTVVAVGVFGVRTLSKLARRNPEVVHQQVLAPGQAITISHTTESRRDLARREAAERAAAKTAKAERRARAKASAG